ncbi:MAG: 50S ribosomal protein L25 [Thermovirga sp.]|nr:50S ribosomal protein L25 [Thermovirga sp.]
MTLNARIPMKRRETGSKGANKKIRKEGYIPGIYYGPELKEAVPVMVDAKAIRPFANSAHWETIRIECQFEDGTEAECLMKEIQREPLTGEILHIDFLKLAKGHKVMVNVPVDVVGKDVCVGVKQGGILEILMHEIEMEVLPKEIPESIVVDVSKLGIDEVIHIKDLPLPESAVVEQDPNTPVVMISTARIEVEETEVEEEETEVEVIKKGKKEEGE